jgi:hypothetical protein
MSSVNYFLPVPILCSVVCQRLRGEHNFEIFLIN